MGNSRILTDQILDMGLAESNLRSHCLLNDNERISFIIKILGGGILEDELLYQ